jgi:hypothetical protein
MTFLPECDILSSVQRVSRTWNAIVQSPTFQTRLWMRPQADEVASPAGFAASHVWPVPILDATVRFNDPVYFIKVAHNSIFSSSIRQFGSGTFKRYKDKSKLPACNSTKLTWTTQMSGVAQPTCLQMYLTEPRITTAQLEVLISLRLGSRPRLQHPRTCRPCDFDPKTSTFASVRDASGLTCGSIFHAVDKFCQSIPGEIPEGDNIFVRFFTEQ